MKVAISTSGRDLECEVHQRFGRTPWMLYVDTTNKVEPEAVSSGDHAGADQGVGIQTAREVVAHGAQILLTGHCGPRAYEVLKSAGVYVYTGVEGTAADALAWLAGGYLVPTGKADRAEHWS